MEPARARWLNFSREGGQEHGALPSPWLSSGLSHLHPIPVEVDETQQSRENITKCPSSLVVRCGQVNYPDRQSPAYVGRPYRGPGDSHCEAPPSPKRASWGPAGLGPAWPRRRSGNAQRRPGAVRTSRHATRGPAQQRRLGHAKVPPGIALAGPAHQRGQAAGGRAFAVALLSPRPRDSGKRASSELPLGGQTPPPRSLHGTATAFFPAHSNSLSSLKRKKCFLNK